MEIRMAIENDSKDLSILKKKIWETTYRGIYDDEIIDNYDYYKREEKFKRLILDNTQEVYVCLIDKKIVGYMILGESLHERLEGYDLTINDLGVLSEYQGMGIGKKFVEIAKSKKQKLFNCCNYYNDNAKKFYKKMGGTIIKTEIKETKAESQVYYVYD